MPDQGALGQMEQIDDEEVDAGQACDREPLEQEQEDTAQQADRCEDARDAMEEVEEVAEEEEDEALEEAEEEENWDEEQDEEYEEEQLEEEEEEEEEYAEDAYIDEEEEKDEQEEAQQASEQPWPLPQQTTRRSPRGLARGPQPSQQRWHSGVRAAATSMDKVQRHSPEEKGRRPTEEKDGGVMDDQGATSSIHLRREVRRLEEENRALRLEIGHEKFKVQKLSKMSEEASRSHRNEHLARRSEAKAVKDLQEARDYVDRRDEFYRNEKGELLQQIKEMDKQMKEVADRECGLRLQLQEALVDQRDWTSRVDDARRDAEKWQKDAQQTAEKLKRADQRLQQLEQKRLDDRAKIKALAEKLREVLDAGPELDMASRQQAALFVSDAVGSGSYPSGPLASLLPMKRPPSPHKGAAPVKASPVASAGVSTKGGGSLVRRSGSRPPSAAKPSGTPGGACASEDKDLELLSVDSGTFAQVAACLRTCGRWAGAVGQVLLAVGSALGMVEPAQSGRRKGAKRAGARKGDERVARPDDIVDTDVTSRQNYILVTLVVLIAGLAIIKLYS